MSPSLTRRDALVAGTATGVAFLIAGRELPATGSDVAEAASGSCTMTPSKTEGPYFVDEKLNRSDVTGGQAGVPLVLKLQVFDASNDCAPVAGATVDIWHANAAGRYSDVAQNGTSGQTWLRGYQVTDADGLATFTTIWPGWYTGRAVHIHFKVRASGLEFTSQLFFTDAMNGQVFSTYEPYRSRSPQTPDTADSRDGIYGTDGASLLLNPVLTNGTFDADFSVGLSSGSSTTTPGATSTPAATATPTTEASDTTVGAALTAVAMRRTAAGSRRVRLTLRLDEPVVVSARLTRGGKTKVRRTASPAAGTRILSMTVPDRLPGGAAKLRLTFTDAAGNHKRVTRTVHLTRRRG